MAVRRSIGVVLVAVVLVVSGQRLSSKYVKVTGESSVKIQKSINHEDKHSLNFIHQGDHFTNRKSQDVHTHRDPIDEPLFDFNDTDFHSLADKPSKFDKDISELIHTDLKSMHENEAARLKSEREKGQSNGSTNATSPVSTTISANDVRWNSTRRIDTSIDYEETTFKNDGSNDSNDHCDGTLSIACLEEELEHLVEKMSSIEVLNITDFVQIVRNSSTPKNDVSVRDNSVMDKVARYANQHILKIRMPHDVFSPRGSRTFFGAIFQGKSSFLTGFGLGFLAFGFKKLMLPLFIGMQIFKSVIIALFLPSILGGLGKILGKSVSSFSQVSQSAAAQPEESFEFKDNADIYNDDYMHHQPIGTLPASEMYGNQGLMNTGNQYSGTPGTNQRISYANTLSDNYYSRNSMQGSTTKRQDYKIFHEIPTSSLLLTNYDPFYSPLLSRLDAVFSRLGHSTEGCREYAICAMYRSPARYAPYSNLVSAQLSRELNELRKPTSDNPDVLRFFKYMKAAKDGQDGVQCEDVYTECANRGNNSGQNQAMLATYQDINKLVQARKI